MTSGHIRAALTALVIALVLGVVAPSAGLWRRRPSAPPTRTSRSSRMPPTPWTPRRATSGCPWRSPLATARPSRGPAGSSSTTPSSRSSPGRPTFGSRVPRGPASRWPGGPRTPRSCGSTSVTPVQRQGGDDEAGLRPARAGGRRRPAGPGGKRPRHAARLGVRVQRSPWGLGRGAVPARLGRRRGVGRLARRTATADGGTVLSAGPLATPLDFFAFVSAQRPAVYVARSLTVPVAGQGVELELQARGRTIRNGRTGPARCSRMRSPCCGRTSASRGRSRIRW